MGVAYAKLDAIVTWSQGTSPLSKGDVWDDRAPLVVERPDLFDTEPTRIRGKQPDEAPVETATSAPGERRTQVKRKS